MRYGRREQERRYPAWRWKKYHGIFLETSLWFTGNHQPDIETKKIRRREARRKINRQDDESVITNAKKLVRNFDWLW